MVKTQILGVDLFEGVTILWMGDDLALWQWDCPQIGLKSNQSWDYDGMIVGWLRVNHPSD